jgi:hypothetical protein
MIAARVRAGAESELAGQLANTFKVGERICIRVNLPGVFQRQLGCELYSGDVKSILGM